jgi:hypothetical protein
VAGHHRPKPSCISARTTLAGNAALAYSTVRRGRPCLSVRGPRVAGPPSGGALEGRTSGGVTAFLGVPYAAAPFGENRMRPPQPAAPWSGTRLATGYGPTVPPTRRLPRRRDPARVRHHHPRGHPSAHRVVGEQPLAAAARDDRADHQGELVE